ncbi:hypothetical protein [Carboxylicivirga caseinilyticus]|uniref:hypothetical protein n=1 Tax=Carboxylicivirga caseinilyticus TaxID=3417572 RepID=UPI003D35907E|nr:hypothetical protein [Marinilabiliaceae bacterium A049]
MESNKTIRQIQIIYFAIVIVLAAFAGFAFYFVFAIGKVSSFDLQMENNLKSLNVILALVGIPSSYMFFKRKVSHIDRNMSFDRKVIQYRTAFFIKMTTLEGLSLISILIYLSTGEINQLIVFGLLYLFMLLNYPSVNSIKKDLEEIDNDL